MHLYYFWSPEEKRLTHKFRVIYIFRYREQRPIQQYGSSEAIASCAWSTHGGSPLLIAGMGYKYLRTYDIRGKKKICEVVICMYWWFY